MKILIPAAAVTLVAIFAGVLPAADQQLLNLVMPDANSLAGVNVDQAKATAFGQFLLNRAETQDQHLQQFVTMTGFNPTTDLHELLLAASGTPPHQQHLVLALGSFLDTGKIQAAAQAAGGVPETYKGILIIESPKHSGAFAFLSSSLAVAGDVASVKGAIDRQGMTSSLPNALQTLVTQWDSNDAWGVTEIPADLRLQQNPAANPALQNMFTHVQTAAGGVKFGQQGASVTAQAQTDTPENATALVNVLQFLGSLAQAKAQQTPQVAALRSLSVSASGNLVNISLTVPETALEQLPAQHRTAPGQRTRRPRGQNQ
ncbi:MAG TPA: hypothetical protein VJ732_09920 [Bryobacteraceae bacterium]|nr:hypothetical protein [Bryobacteraceae bacterium]